LPFRSSEFKARRHACNRDSQLNVEHQRNRAGSQFGHGLPFILTPGKGADPPERQKQGKRQGIGARNGFSLCAKRSSSAWVAHVDHAAADIVEAFRNLHVKL
jgi:hypothetical protein